MKIQSISSVESDEAASETLTVSGRVRVMQSYRRFFLFRRQRAFISLDLRWPGRAKVTFGSGIVVPVSWLPRGVRAGSQVKVRINVGSSESTVEAIRLSV